MPTKLEEVLILRKALLRRQEMMLRLPVSICCLPCFHWNNTSSPFSQSGEDRRAAAQNNVNVGGLWLLRLVFLVVPVVWQWHQIPSVEVWHNGVFPCSFTDGFVDFRDRRCRSTRTCAIDCLPNGQAVLGEIVRSLIMRSRCSQCKAF